MQITRRKVLAAKLGVSLPTLWRMEKAGILPPKIRISLRAVGWKSSDIETFILKRQENDFRQEVEHE
jgi:predicted DNA-binding transcriptional regulator AlpA